MPEISGTRKSVFIRQLFVILADAPEGLPAKEALSRLEESLSLTDYEKGFMSSGPQRFEKTVRFSTIAPVKAGWMAKNKGIWTITEEGRKALVDHQDPAAFRRAASALYAEWNRGRNPKDASDGDVDDDAGNEATEAVASITFERAEEQAWEEIGAYLRSMPPYEFQELVAELLRAMGYHVSWVAPPGKDDGIDILAWTDPLGTHPPRIKVQVKRQVASVSVDGLRSFLSVLGNDDVGLFVCTGGFTRDAEQAARTQETRKVTLIDLERLFDLWVEHYGKLSDAARQRLPLQPIYFFAPRT